MVWVLLSILTVCPLMACGPALDSDCCHRSQPSPTCPKTTLQECPYSLLEKGKTAAAVTQVLSVALDPVSPDVSVSDDYSFIQTTNRVPSSNGLYLRIRVLLI